MSKGNPAAAIDHLSQGARLLMQPGLKRYVLVPLAVNIGVFILITLAFIRRFSDLLTTLTEWLPDWLAFIAWILWLLAVMSLLILYGYTFNLLTTLIAAPFYGLLAEKIETELTGIPLPSEPWHQLILRTLKRELIKLWYFISRGLLILLAIVISFFIPGLNLAVWVLTGFWAAWCMAVQYADYPADNHQIAFKQLRKKLRQQPLTSFSFGGLIMAGSMVPVLNIFMMPVAVAGATVYWVRNLKKIP